MPASSPASRSTTSALKPARSAQRRYMRISICAQSWDSVPPAPGWMDRMTFFLSCGPDRTTFSSNASSALRAAVETLLDLGRHALVAGLGGHFPQEPASPPPAAQDPARSRASAPAPRAPGPGPGPCACPPRSSPSPSPRRWRRVAPPCRRRQRWPRRSSRRFSSSATSRFSSPSMPHADLRKIANPRTPAPRPRQP